MGVYPASWIRLQKAMASNYDNAITGVILITIVVIDALMQHRAAVNNRHARLSARTAASGKEGTK